MADVPIGSACLCLGPKQSGKTHLLSSLQSAGSITNVSHSVQTIGTNIFTIKLPEPVLKNANATAMPSTSSAPDKKPSGSGSIRRSTKKASITILEIGGSMAPMWGNYLNNVSKILYVIDTSNLCQISAAGEMVVLCSEQWLIFTMHCDYMYFRRAFVHTVGRSALTAYQIPTRSIENGLGLSSNAEWSLAYASIP